MSAALDLTGKRFGKLTALRPQEKGNRHGQRLWLCKCECGREIIVPTSSLRTGNTTSCGCRRLDSLRQRNARPINRRRTKQRWQDNEVKADGTGKRFLSPGAFARSLGISHTLLKYQWRISCPWLKKSGIETHDFRVLGRDMTYYSESDRDAIRTARAKMPLVPDVPGYVNIEAAAADMGIDVSQVYRKLRALKVKPHPETGKAKKDGRAHPRGYIRQATFDNLCKAPMQATTAAPAAQTATPNKGGRPSNDNSHSRKKQRWCYEQYTAQPQKKLSRILEAAKREFGDMAPTNEGQIITYATRWAEHKNLPIPRRN